MIWDAAVAHALALDGAEASASYGRPAIKANGNTFLSVGQEADTSFVLHLDPDLVAMLIDRAHARASAKRPPRPRTAR